MEQQDIIAELLRQLDDERRRNSELVDTILNYTGIKQSDVKIIVPEGGGKPLSRGHQTWGRVRSTLERMSRAERFSQAAAEANEELLHGEEEEQAG